MEFFGVSLGVILTIMIIGGAVGGGVTGTMQIGEGSDGSSMSRLQSFGKAASIGGFMALMACIVGVIGTIFVVGPVGGLLVRLGLPRWLGVSIGIGVALYVFHWMSTREN